MDVPGLHMIERHIFAAGSSGPKLPGGRDAANPIRKPGLAEPQELGAAVTQTEAFGESRVSSAKTAVLAHNRRS